MSLTGFVLAFAGALAAKVRPAPADSQRLARREELAGAQLLNEVIAERDVAHWALETALGELDATRAALGQARSERDALRARERMAQQVYAQAQQNQLGQYQAQQNLRGQYQAQQNACYNLQQAQLAQWASMQGSQGLGAQGQAQGLRQDCTCVPGRAAAFGRGPIGVD
jgi:hypothetical protein